MALRTRKKRESELSNDSMGVTEETEENEHLNSCDEECCAKRRVTFPCDLVTSYCEPPNPWAGVPQCTTEELIAAYRGACEKHEVRPISIVLQQLKGIDLSICNDRYEMLSLRGNKLDVKHMETLEEIFRRVQFKNLDFEDTNMDDDTAISLFDMIEYYETCTRLNIALNSKISCRGWQICSRMMKKTPQLEILDVRGILFVENYMPLLARALRCGSILRVIHMENCNISGRNLLILVSALKINDTLIELFLANNKMVVSDGIQLGSLLKVNTTLQLLDLRNNSLGDEGIRHLCDGLYDQRKETGLITLILWSNGLTHVGMVYVASALSSCRHLQTLNLGYNNITNEGAHSLREGLLRNRSLLRLSLQAGKIGCEGAVALAEYIADTKQLLRLDLRENDIKTGGVIALALALKVNESLSRLDLDPEIKKDSSIRDYAEQQREFRKQIDQRLVENRRLAQQREEKRLEEEQLRLEIESSSIASSEVTLDGVREETLDSPCDPPPDKEAAAGTQESSGAVPTLEVETTEPQSTKDEQRSEEQTDGSETLERATPLSIKIPEPGLMVDLDLDNVDHASPQLGSQVVHSPTDEVMAFLSPKTAANIILCSEAEVIATGDEVMGAGSVSETTENHSETPGDEEEVQMDKEEPTVKVADSECSLSTNDVDVELVNDSSSTDSTEQVKVIADTNSVKNHKVQISQEAIGEEDTVG